MAPAGGDRPRGPAAIFVNEGAGSARSARVRAAVAFARRALDAEVDITATRSPAELSAWLVERLGGCATAVIVGGDGSLGVAYNVAAAMPPDRAPVLGYIPAGFGNATRHLLRLPSHPAALAGVLSRGAARPVDLVAVGAEGFGEPRLGLFAGAGWDAVVAGRYAAGGARKLRGWAVAVAGSLGPLHRRFAVRVTADGTVVHEGPMILSVAGTTPFYGRGMLVNPGARTDAGRLTLRVYPGPEPMLALEAVRWFAHRRPAARGVHAQSVTVAAMDGRAVPVQADGDVIGEAGEWSFEVRPKAVRLIGNW
jgi:diacylglycerol kinase (ATP)